MLSVLRRGKFLGFQDSRIPGSPRIPEDSTPAGFQDSRIPRIPGFPGFLVFPPSILWSILRGNGAHTPIQDYESILREVLNPPPFALWPISLIYVFTQRAGRGVEETEEGEGVADEHVVHVVHPRATEAGVEGAEGAGGGTAA